MAEMQDIIENICKALQHAPSTWEIFSLNLDIIFHGETVLHACVPNLNSKFVVKICYTQYTPF